MQGRAGNEDGREPDQTVEDGDQLRQVGDLHAKRDKRADRAAEHDAGEDEQPGRDLWQQQGRGGRDRHADDADQVAGARRFRARQAPDRQDEADRREEIGV